MTDWHPVTPLARSLLRLADTHAVEACRYGWVTSYAGMAAGEFEVLSDIVERFVDHPLITLKAFLKSRQ